MLDHLSLGSSDLKRATAFYDAALAPLGFVRVWTYPDAVGYGRAGGDDKLAIKRRPGFIAPGPGFHLALTARTRNDVDAFFHAAVARGGTSNGEPGLRPRYGPGYYAAFVVDPDGHCLEAVCHEPSGSGAKAGTRYIHTNLIAYDWEVLAKFYIRVFGCTPLEPRRDQRGEWLERGTAVQGAHLRGQHLRLPGCGDDGPTLEIYSYDEVVAQSRPVANRAGFGHIAFAVDDMASKLRAVIEAGGAAHGAVVTTQVDGVGRLTFTYARDPEGNLIELQAWA